MKQPSSYGSDDVCSFIIRNAAIRVSFGKMFLDDDHLGKLNPLYANIMISY